jgi:hypothetical protein
MLDYIKERIALIMLLVAGDSISLISFIKAPEIRTECTSLAAAISLLLMLMISLSVIYLLAPLAVKKVWMAVIVGACLLLWIGFIFSYLRFSETNDQYGKVITSKVLSAADAGDSVIVGGCAYTPEAQREVDSYQQRGRTLSLLTLLSDFNFDTGNVWDEASRDCARKKIVLAFSIMIAFLVAGVTLTYEFIALAKKEKKPPGGNKPE